MKSMLNVESTFTSKGYSQNVLFRQILINVLQVAKEISVVGVLAIVIIVKYERL